MNSDYNYRNTINYSMENIYTGLLCNEESLNKRDENEFQFEQTNNDFSDLAAATYEYNKNIAIAKQVASDLKYMEFEASCKKNNAEFGVLKYTYATIFKNPEIKQDSAERTYPFPIEVQQDQKGVTSTSKPLYTSGLGDCICVMARGISETNGPCLGMAHTSGYFEPKEVLTNIKEKLQKKGCDSKTIEFYLVGGQLPYETDYNFSEGTLKLQETFLSLSEEFNIIGAQFNLAKGEEESLSVLLTSDEILWTKGEFTFISEAITSETSDTVEFSDQESQQDSEISNSEIDESINQSGEGEESEYDLESLLLRNEKEAEELFSHNPLKRKLSENESDGDRVHFFTLDL